MDWVAGWRGRGILQVSTGALVITITFIEKIGKPYDDWTNKNLIAFWSLFLAVILLNILSYYTAKKSMDFKIENLDQRFKDFGNDWQSKSTEKFSTWKFCTKKCNRATLVLFVLGAIFFSTMHIKCSFIAMNNQPKRSRLQWRTTKKLTNRFNPRILQKNPGRREG